MTTVLPSKTGNILLANYKTGSPFEIYAGTVIIAHSGVAIYGNASAVFTIHNAGNHLAEAGNGYRHRAHGRSSNLRAEFRSAQRSSSATMTRRLRPRSILGSGTGTAESSARV